MRRIGLVGTLILLAHGADAQTVPRYRNPRLPVESRVQDLLRRMSLEEKFWQLYMIPGDLADTATHDYTHGIFGLQVSSPAHIAAIQRWFMTHTRLGIPIIPFDEAVHGLVRQGSTMFPQAIALAAAFDTALMDSVAGAIALETRGRGVRQVLSPVINVASDVRWGRVEETYGEDPFLVSRMGDAFVRAFEQHGVIATPKHFVANVGEGGRDSYPIEVSDRMLDEEFLPPFLSAIQGAHARSIMTAYNSVDGVPATQNHHLLTDLLRKQWRFTGFVISDAAATGGATVLHMTEPSTPVAAQHAWEAGLDVVFQSSWEQYRPYWAAVQRGLIAPRIIDSAVARVLRAKFELGLFDQAYADTATADTAGHGTLARLAAEDAIVLLKNDGVLPLDASRVHRVALIGRDAAEARLGGYSAEGARSVNLVDAFRAQPSFEVTYAPGPPRLDTEAVVIPEQALSSDSGSGLRAEYFDNIALSGVPRVVRRDRQVDFRWTFNSPDRQLNNNWYSVRWSGTLTVPAGGAHLGIEGSDGWRLWVDGRLLMDDWAKRTSRRMMSAEALAPGAHQLRLEYFETTGNARVRLMWDAGARPEWRAQIDSAVAAARSADVAIIAAGIEEGEFRDRALLGLPGHQQELIEAVAATGKPVVVVLVGGSAITMPWLDRASAVIDAWYPGQDGGTAILDVLRGAANPAGRLPVTFPIAEGQLPLRYNHKPTGRGDDYLDLTGQPLFPFGFGLSYTTFDYRNLRITPDTMTAADSARVTCTIVNTGRVAGDEVVQLYIRDELASVARPVMELKGFRRVHLVPGDSVDVEFVIGRNALRMLDRERHWIVEPG